MNSFANGTQMPEITTEEDPILPGIIRLHFQTLPPQARSIFNSPALTVRPFLRKKEIRIKKR